MTIKRPAWFRTVKSKTFCRLHFKGISQAHTHCSSNLYGLRVSDYSHNDRTGQQSLKLVMAIAILSQQRSAELSGTLQYHVGQL